MTVVTKRKLQEQFVISERYKNQIIVFCKVEQILRFQFCASKPVVKIQIFKYDAQNIDVDGSLKKIVVMFRFILTIDVFLRY